MQTGNSRISQNIQYNHIGQLAAQVRWGPAEASALRRIFRSLC